jgi:glycine/D-amino acid oxidase-like deaminating enzyme/nitrite reductase/ring-hydroxylating ferredoxin subunit
MATTHKSTMVLASPEHFMKTTGSTDAVWVHTEPYSKRPQYPKLTQDLDTDVCVIGSGIAGISSAYELVKRGVNVVMIEARDILSGESGRTSGHLSSGLDEGYTVIKQKHGDKGAAIVQESHLWAIDHVGDIAKELGIECEYRKLPSYDISQYTRGEKGHAEDVKDLKEEVAYYKSLGGRSEWKEGYAIKGWTGQPDQRDAAVTYDQATFHPTKYLLGVLKWLSSQPNFSCYTRTRMLECQEKGLEVMGFGTKEVKVTTDDGKTITCKDAVMATVVPLQKLSVVAEMEYDRTYCIAMRVPKGSYEDALIYDTNDSYKYIRYTECDDKDDYMVAGGMDHKVGQHDNEKTLYQGLESWVRERFPQGGSVDYKWSGQVFNSVDHVAFIGLNPGTKHTYIVTGDCGNGLTHGTIAGRLIADQITNKENAWAELYDPSRKASILKSAKDMITHDVQINSQYKRLVQSDITDIEDLMPGTGGVLNSATSKPIAVYKTESGEVRKMSAFCPHMKGVVCWNHAEASWDCPVHASRFSSDGICLIGPAKAHLNAENDEAVKAQQKAINS